MATKGNNSTTYRKRRYRRKGSTARDFQQAASSRWEQAQEGFSYTFRAVGNPVRTILHFGGALAAVALVYILVDAVTYGFKTPTVRATMPRSFGQSVSYQLVELIIDAKNSALTGESGGQQQLLPLPDEYAPQPKEEDIEDRK